MWLESILVGVVALVSLYYWATINDIYFRKRGIPYEKPFFLLGSSKDIVLRRKSVLDSLIELYNKSDCKVFGVFDSRSPILLIRDPQLIKQIMIKNFDHFVNRSSFEEIGEKNIFNSSLFFMRDARWRDMRNTLSPAFTGSKLRHMFPLIDQAVQEAVAYLHAQPSANTRQGVEVDVKDLTTRLTNDIIASTAFGLQVNSFVDRDNDFYRFGKKVTKFTLWQNVKMLLIMNCPGLSRLIRLNLFEKELTDYFVRLVLDAIEYRREHNVYRPDMINLLMEARGLIPKDTSTRAPHREWTDTDVIAQCFLFFVAGFEPTSVAMCFAAHELMENPDVQEKLLQEITQVTEGLDGKPLTYEILHDMRYMDMYVSELLRKWPVTLLTDRVCNKDFVYEVDGERVRIEKDLTVRIPMCAIHRDPQFFANPSKIDPERFSEARKGDIEAATYLPFGLGPRKCIGDRLALIEIKAFLFYLLRDFRIEASPQTTMPMELSIKDSLQLTPKNGFWLNLVARSRSTSDCP